MLFLSAIMELVGFLLMAVPIVRLIRANRRLALFEGFVTQEVSGVAARFRQIEVNNLVLPRKEEIVLISFGAALCFLAVLIKVIYYFGYLQISWWPI